MLAEWALEAVIANITAHAFAIAGWRFLLVGLWFFHFNTY
jgi:hypothetical protein